MIHVSTQCDAILNFTVAHNFIFSRKEKLANSSSNYDTLLRDRKKASAKVQLNVGYPIEFTILSSRVLLIVIFCGLQQIAQMWERYYTHITSLSTSLKLLLLIEMLSSIYLLIIFCKLSRAAALCARFKSNEINSGVLLNIPKDFLRRAREWVSIKCGIIAIRIDVIQRSNWFLKKVKKNFLLLRNRTLDFKLNFRFFSTSIGCSNHQKFF